MLTKDKIIYWSEETIRKYIKFFLWATISGFLLFPDFLPGSLAFSENLIVKNEASRSQEIIVGGSLFRNLAKKSSPSVVNIQSLKKIPHYYGDFHFGMQGIPRQPSLNEFETQGGGSGFIISNDGYILTTNHVVAGSDQVQVSLFNGKTYIGKMVGFDELMDIALIKVTVPSDLPSIPMGSSKQLEPGDWVLAIGNPFGLELTVTAGIVSAKGRSLGKSPYDDFIQIDAPINPGNSGGPLINTQGEVVGINSAIFSQGQGLGFSSPIDLVKKILPQLKEKGRVVRSWLGLVVRDITLDEKMELDHVVNRGSLVMNVFSNSPAEKAGILPYDIIVEFDGKQVKSSHEFPRMIAHSLAGKKIPVTLLGT